MTSLHSSGVRRIGSNLSSSSRPTLAGYLTHKDNKGKVLGRKRIYASREVVIGRDRSRCQYVLNDPYTSKRHLRIYTVVYENDEPGEVDTLVYAEDLSQNGTYWNGSFIGKGNGGFLLSDQDILRLSRRTYIVFTAALSGQSSGSFDYIQETEMAKFRKDYTPSDRLLGAGAFGRVFMAIEQNTRHQVACKMVDLRVLMPGAQTRFGRGNQPAAAEDIDSRVQVRKVKAWAIQQKRKDALEKQLSKYYREVDILASISHPNIIGIEKVYIADNTMYMMLEIVTAGDLFSYIESKNGTLLEVEAAVIIRQILIALSFLHSKNIVHRDIKPDNILMTTLAAGCRVILTDFGAARRIESRLHRMSSIIGTHEYAAPEILGFLKIDVEAERPGYTRAVDMWAVGCVSVVLLTGGLAFCDPVTQLYSENLARNCDLEFLRKSKEWQAIRHRPKGFVEKLLVLDETVRLTAEEAIQHSWFQNEVHKNDFEALYQRTIKHWRPRIPKPNVVEFQDSGCIRELKCSEDFIRPSRKGGSRVQSPVEPPYKPFPRQMHQHLWPPRSPTKGLSEEALLAIESSSPTSAVRLRIRAVSISPRSQPSTLPSSNITVTGSLTDIRATSEPPPSHSLFRTRTRSRLESQGSLQSTLPWVHSGTPYLQGRSGQKDAIVRPPTPRPQRGLSTEPPKTPSGFSKLFASATSPASSTTGHSSPANGKAADADGPKKSHNVLGNFRNLDHSGEHAISNTVSCDELGSDRFGNPLSAPNTSHNLGNPGGNAVPVEDEVGPNVSGNTATPHSNSKLKRRASTSLMTPTFKRRRNTSVFDLVEDDDTEQPPASKSSRRSIFELSEDQREKSSRVSRSPLAYRPKGAPGLKPRLQPANLYLPR